MKALLLAAGFGTRLKPLTDSWPKCLMPVGSRPLLEYWLETLKSVDISQVYVNTHFYANEVLNFLERPKYKGWVYSLYEKNLLGTAATVSANYNVLHSNEPTLIIHADNWVSCDFKDFLNFHLTGRPRNTVMTMMTFEASHPQECGVVELDKFGTVIGFHEKVANPPGNIANGAVYIVEPEVLSWLATKSNLTDLSTEVLPRYIGKIATWHNYGIHRDIGSIQSLLEAQNDLQVNAIKDCDSWSAWFENHPIHEKISSYANVLK